MKENSFHKIILILVPIISILLATAYILYRHFVQEDEEYLPSSKDSRLIIPAVQQYFLENQIGSIESEDSKKDEPSE